MAADPNLNLQDLAKILNQLARQSNSLSSNVRDVSDILADFKSPLSKYEDYIKQIRALGSDEVKRRADLLLDLKKAQEDGKKVAANKKREIAKLEEDIKDTANARRRANAEVKKLVAKYGQFAEATEGPKEKAQQLKNTLDGLKQQLKSATKEHEQQTHKLGRLGQVLQLREKELQKVSFKEAGNRIVQQGGKTLIDGIQRIFSVAKFGDIAKGLYDTTQREIATGIEVARASLTMEDDIRLAKLGADRAKAIEVFKNNRQAVLAMGGNAGALDFIEQNANSVKGITNLEDRFKYAAEQATLMVTAGIKPTTKNATLLTSEFEKMRKRAGMVPDEFNAMMTDMVNDSSIQTELRIAASEKERQLILKGNAARIAEYRMMGMTTAQAMAMNKSLAKTAALPAIDRIRNAARMQALMGAMGMSGGARASELTIKKMKTPAEEAELNRYRMEANKKATENRGNGLTSELIQDALGGALDTENITAPMSEYNTSLIKASEVTRESVDKLGEVSQTLKDILNAFNTAKQIFNTPYIQMGAGAIGTSLGAFAGSAGGTLAGGAALYKMMKARGIMASGNSPVPPGAPGASRMARVGNFMKSPVGKGGIIGTVAGIGTQYIGGELRERGHETGGNITDILGAGMSGAGMGAMVGSAGLGLGALPGAVIGGLIGAGVKAYDIYGTKKDVGGPSSDEPGANSSAQTVAALNQQLAKMDKGNDYLKTLAEHTPRMVELQEKQLVLMTMNEKQRTDESTKQRMMAGNRFTTRYGYVF